MRRWPLKNLMKQCHFMQCMLQDNISFLADLVEVYGYTHLSKQGDLETDEVVHDFVYFCITKATRSLRAIDILLTAGQFEDAKVLARSVYECYLNGAFARTNPSRIDELVSAKVGIYAGYYQHPKSAKGSLQHHVMLHPETGQVIPYGVSLAEMARGTGQTSDAGYHDLFYSFLSEFAHVHMIASGSYRKNNDTAYNHEPASNGLYHSIFMCCLCGWLIVHLGAMIEKDQELIREVKLGAKFLLMGLRQMEFDEKLLPLKDRLTARLGDI